jgi:hypothetical protein
MGDGELMLAYVPEKGPPVSDKDMCKTKDMLKRKRSWTASGSIRSECAISVFEQDQ